MAPPQHNRRRPADRERHEAIRFAQQIADENKKLKTTLSSGEATYIQTLKEKNIKVSLFINPNPNDVELAKKLNADSVEINTGRYSQSFTSEIQNNELQKIIETAKVCQDLTINCHAGHGLNYQNVVKIASIPNIKELNIGHSIISYSITVGLKLALKKMILLINKPSIT